MRPFLRGFADELIKIAGGDPWSDIPRPPSTATGNEQAPKPANALPASNAALNAIPKQRMDWSPSAKKDTWQPSPGFRLEQPKPQPAPAPKPTGAVKAKPKNVDPAFENAEGRGRRQAGEYLGGTSRNLDARKPGVELSYDKMTLKPGEKTKSPMQPIREQNQKELDAQKAERQRQLDNRMR